MGWLSMRGVVNLTSLSESTIRRLIVEGRFPQALEVTRGRKVFVRDEVEHAMNRLIAERRRQAPEAAA